MRGELTPAAAAPEGKALCVKPGCQQPIGSKRLMICRDHISRMGTARNTKGGREAALRYKERGYEGKPLCATGICFAYAEPGSELCARHLGQPLKLDTPQEIAQALRRLAEAVEGLAVQEDRS